jgi:hypothetical protein
MKPAPARSKPPRAGCGGDAGNQRSRASGSSAAGTRNQNTDGQPQPWVSRPPMVGPNIAPSPNSMV